MTPTLRELDEIVARYDTARERERGLYLLLSLLGVEGSAAHGVVKGRRPWPGGEVARQLREDHEQAHLPPIVNRKLRGAAPVDLTPWVDRARTRRALRGFGRWNR